MNAELIPEATAPIKKEQSKRQKELKKEGRKGSASHEAAGQEGATAVLGTEVSKQNGMQPGFATINQKPAQPSPRQPAPRKTGAVTGNTQARTQNLVLKAEGKNHAINMLSTPRIRLEENLRGKLNEESLVDRAIAITPIPLTMSDLQAGKCPGKRKRRRGISQRRETNWTASFPNIETHCLVDLRAIRESPGRTH